MTARFTTGVDIIEVDRIERAIMRWHDRFLQRIYTEDELTYCRGKVDKLAGRFAAKEATSKALGTSIRVLSWKDIEVLPSRGGKPHVRLHGKAERIAQLKGITGLEISIAHSRRDAVAFVVAWSDSA